MPLDRWIVDAADWITSTKNVISRDQAVWGAMWVAALLGFFAARWLLPSVQGVPGLATVPSTAGHDVPAKLQAIDEAVALLDHNGDFEQPIDYAGRLCSEALAKLKSRDRDALVINLNETRRRFSSNSIRLADIQQRYDRFPDINEILNQTYQTKLFEECQNFVTAIQKTDDPPSPNVDFFITPYIDQFREGLAAVGGFRTRALTQLKELRKTISV